MLTWWDNFKMKKQKLFQTYKFLEVIWPHPDALRQQTRVQLEVVDEKTEDNDVTDGPVNTR